MIGRMFAAAIAAGALAGVLVSGLQHVTTTPLILAAEVYETASSEAAWTVGAPRLLDGAEVILAHSDPAHDGAHDDAGAAAWAPADGLERTLYTAGANIVVGVGYALLLVAAFALHGRAVDARRGLLWGIAGFAVFTLAPAAGLPPELPGTQAADLVGRQGWWFFAAGATAVGLWLMVFARPGALKWPMAGGGALILALPHLIGAPHPHGLAAGAVPAELSAQYAAVTIAVGAVFWALLGWFAGHFYARFAEGGARADAAAGA